MPLPARAAGPGFRGCLRRSRPRSCAEGGPSNVSQRAARSPHGRRACGRWVCSRSPRGAVAVFALRASRRLFRPPLGGWDWNLFPVGVSDRLWILGICPEPVSVWRSPGSLAGRRVARPARGPSGRGGPPRAGPPSPAGAACLRTCPLPEGRRIPRRAAGGPSIPFRGAAIPGVPPPGNVFFVEQP